MTRPVTADVMISALRNVEKFLSEHSERFEIGSDVDMFYYLDAEQKYDLYSDPVANKISSLTDDLEHVRFAAGESPYLSTVDIRSIGQVLIAFADLLDK